MSPGGETITGKRNNPCHRSLLEHAGKIKDKDAAAARRGAVLLLDPGQAPFI